MSTIRAVDLDFAVLADGVAGRPDGKLDIYGAGWDTIYASNAPAAHARLVLAVRLLLSRHEAEHKHRLDVIIQGADGDEVARAVGNVDPLPSEARRAIRAGRKAGLGMVLTFENIVFPRFGDYQIVIQWDTNDARPPLALTVAKAPSP